VGQPLSAHLAWLHAKDLGPAKADIWLPHDGSTHDRVFDVSYESALRQAGFRLKLFPIKAEVPQWRVLNQRDAYLDRYGLTRQRQPLALKHLARITRKKMTFA
jgi:hypothetical protein